nr:hypothetical protein [Pseudomonas sp.]
MFFASLAAIITPSLIITLTAIVLGGSPSDGLIPILIIYGLIISAAHFIALGLPTLTLLNKLNLLKLKYVIAAGFLIAIIPTGIYRWPLPDGQFIGTIEAQIYGLNVVKNTNGVPTMWGWLIYLKETFTPGVLFGIPAAFAFWYFYEGSTAR